MNPKNSRAAAALAIEKVIYQGRQLNRTLDPVLQSWSAQDRRFITEIVNGVVRWFWLLEAFARGVMLKPLRKRDQDIYCLLLAGLYQLEFMRVPNYAGVSESVNAASALGKSWAGGLVNAILKKHSQSRQKLQLDRLDESSRFAHPAWMIDRIRKEWPQHWEKILRANNERPQMALRVNLNRVSASKMLQFLEEHHIRAQMDSNSGGIRLLQRVSVRNLPGFDQGWVSVQGISSQRVAPLLDIQPGQRILDACAAPGGKMLHTLELCSEIDLVAIDIDPSRCRLIHDTLSRGGQKATIVCADAALTENWWDGKYFDRILIDAPCSALGAVSKHPDIKHHRQPQDINAVVKVQQQLLTNLLPLLKPEGKLLYTTCSILACENEDQIRKVVTDDDEFIAEPLPADLGRSTGNGRQRLQGVDAGEGFYCACLVRARQHVS